MSNSSWYLMVSYCSMHRAGQRYFEGSSLHLAPLFPALPPVGCGDPDLWVPGRIFPAPPPVGRGKNNLWLPARIYPAPFPVGCGKQNLWLHFAVSFGRPSSNSKLAKPNRIRSPRLSRPLKSSPWGGVDLNWLLSRGERVLSVFLPAERGAWCAWCACVQEEL